jgi:MSHA pilin protein MshA
MKTLRNEKGFTLIELVMVIVILGILAAVVVPRFADLSQEAEAGALAGVAGGLSSAMATNYAVRSVNGGGVAVANCSDIATVALGGVPGGYTVTAAPIAANTAVNCTVTQDSTTDTAVFVGIGIP